jgi:hypothetical protein
MEQFVYLIALLVFHDFILNFTGDISCCDGTSSSDDGNSNISENTELDMDLSSEVEEDEDEEDDEIPNILHINSDSSTLSKMAVTNGKTLNHVAAKDELNKCNGLKSEKKGDILSENLTRQPLHINGLGEDERSCCDSSVIISSSSNNLEAVARKEISTEDKDMDKNRMKNGQMLDPADLIELVTDEGLLDAIKVCADWLYGDINVIKAYGRGSHTLLPRFITLLNLINVNADAFDKGMLAHICNCINHLIKSFKARAF